MATLHLSALVLRLSRTANAPWLERTRRLPSLQSLPRTTLIRAGGIAAAVAAAAGVAALSRPAGPAPRVPASAIAAGFEANLGQAPRFARFVARGEDFRLFLAPSEMRFEGAGGCSGDTCGAFRMRLVGGLEDVRLFAEDPLPRHAHYTRLLGAGSISAPTFASVVYQNAYPGIDMRFSGHRGELLYSFLVDRGASVDTIRLDLEGAEALHVEESGALVATGSRATLRHAPPFAYQLDAGQQTPVEVRYAVRGEHEIGFDVGTYDIRRPLLLHCGRGAITPR